MAEQLSPSARQALDRLRPPAHPSPGGTLSVGSLTIRQGESTTLSDEAKKAVERIQQSIPPVQDQGNLEESILIHERWGIAPEQPWERPQTPTIPPPSFTPEEETALQKFHDEAIARLETVEGKTIIQRAGENFTGLVAEKLAEREATARVNMEKDLFKKQVKQRENRAKQRLGGMRKRQQQRDKEAKDRQKADTEIEKKRIEEEAKTEREKIRVDEQLLQTEEALRQAQLETQQLREELATARAQQAEPVTAGEPSASETGLVPETARTDEQETVPQAPTVEPVETLPVTPPAQQTTQLPPSPQVRLGWFGRTRSGLQKLFGEKPAQPPTEAIDMHTSPETSTPKAPPAPQEKDSYDITNEPMPQLGERVLRSIQDMPAKFPGDEPADGFWNRVDILRQEGVTYGDPASQLTYDQNHEARHYLRKIDDVSGAEVGTWEKVAFMNKRRFDLPSSNPEDWRFTYFSETITIGGDETTVVICLDDNLKPYKIERAIKKAFQPPKIDTLEGPFESVNLTTPSPEPVQPTEQQQTDAADVIRFVEQRAAELIAQNPNLSVEAARKQAYQELQEMPNP